MNLPLWIAEADIFWLLGLNYVHQKLRWRGIQAVLWPVTLVVRAIARDPFRDPAPLIADPEKIRKLETELGLAQSDQVTVVLAKDPDGTVTQTQVDPAFLGWAREIAEDWTLEYLHEVVDEVHRKYQASGKKEYCEAAEAYGIVYRERMLESCLEIGLPTTVTPHDLRQLKERTKPFFNPEGPHS